MTFWHSPCKNVYKLKLIAERFKSSPFITGPGLLLPRNGLINKSEPEDKRAKRTSLANSRECIRAFDVPLQASIFELRFTSLISCRNQSYEVAHDTYVCTRVGVYFTLALLNGDGMLIFVLEMVLSKTIGGSKRLPDSASSIRVSNQCIFSQCIMRLVTHQIEST
ncbi:hypothetical protein PUN28_015123 [Cardiocondyla obscurior]|uniref:Uncharacterized protein n=1 Tax=Cardiocondyla obscurior TaxID=286306 RepID=A0AAW2F2H6_9HYME